MRLIVVLLLVAHVLSQDEAKDILQNIKRSQNLEAAQTCDDYINSIVQAISNRQMPPVSTSTLLNSGKDLNDLGNQMNCVFNTNYTYLVLQLKAKANIFSIGLCLPNICSQDDLNKYSNQTVSLMNQLYGNNTVSSASYSDPETVYPPFNAGAYIVSVITGFIVLLNIAGSLVTSYGPQSQTKIDPQEKQVVNGSPSIQSDQTGQGSSSYVEVQSSVSEENLLSLAKEPKEGRKQKKLPMWIQVMSCFSFTENLTKLFTIKEEGIQTFKIFNGVRAFSIFWVIYGHDYLVRFRVISNIADYNAIMSNIGWVTLAPSAYFAVDVFFFLGGFLAAYMVIEKMTKMKRLTLAIVPQMWLHRFLRIWPTFAFCLLFYYKLTPYFFSGPIWSMYITETDYCNGTFWRNLLFIDNMWTHTPGLQYCFGWGWYLANDFQIFFITPPLLILCAKNPKAGKILIWAMFVASVSAAYGLSWANNYHVNMPSVNGKPMPDYQDNFYYKPWIRISPYLMGLLYGIEYREWKNGVNNLYSKAATLLKNDYRVQVLFYIIGIGLTQMIIWMIAPLQSDMYSWPDQLQYLYQAFNRVFFVSGVAFCLTPALVGVKYDPARAILGHNIWVPIARISFCMYLVQMFVIYATTFASKQVHYYQNSHMLFFILVDIIISMFVAMVLSLSVEVPFMNLEKILFKGKNQA